MIQKEAGLTQGQLEGGGRVVRLQHADVVVQQGEPVVRVAQEGGRAARVLNVMGCGRDQCRRLVHPVHHLQLAVGQLLQVARRGLRKNRLQQKGRY